MTEFGLGHTRPKNRLKSGRSRAIAWSLLTKISWQNWSNVDKTGIQIWPHPQKHFPFRPDEKGAERDSQRSGLWSPEATPLARGLGMAQIPNEHQKRLSPDDSTASFILTASSRNRRLLHVRCCFHFVIFKGWCDDLRLLRIGAVNRLAVVA